MMESFVGDPSNAGKTREAACLRLRARNCAEVHASLALVTHGDGAAVGCHHEDPAIDRATEV
jgi:hypothetical protein